MTHQYLEEYKTFLKDYNLGVVSGEEVGLLIARMANYFSDYNMLLVSSERKLNLVARDINSRIDESGKPITSSKAQVFVDATNENNEYKEYKTHLQNVEQILNGLKSLQKGIINEFSHIS